MGTPTVKREAAAHRKALLGLSEGQVCQIAGMDRKTVLCIVAAPAILALGGQFGDRRSRSVAT
jgi:hypothetical protein